DAGAGTITVNVASEHGAGRQLTFTADPNAVITADGVTTTLAGLTPGAMVKLQLSQTDSTTVTGITAFGRCVVGPITAVDPNADTITVPTEHDGDHTYNIDPNATVTLDRASSTLTSLTPAIPLIL